MQVGRGSLRRVPPQDEQAVVLVVESQVHRDRVFVAIHRGQVIEHGGVDMGAFGETTAMAVEVDDLGRSPSFEVVGVMALLHPVDGHVGAGIDRLGDDALRWPTLLLQGAGGHPPAKSQGPTMQPA